MKRTWLCILSVLAACVMLAACGKADKSEAAEPSPAASATPTPTPEPTLPPYEPDLLTGEARAEGYALDQRPIAIMINNLTAARPQRGLSKASILTEIKVEGGITRFMAIYQDYATIGEVGPVRSARDQFFQLLLPWQMLYYHEGQSTTMDQYADIYQYGVLNCKDAGQTSYGHRDNSRVNWAGQSRGNGLDYEHTLYTNSEEIQNYITSQNVDMHRAYNQSCFFPFIDYNAAPRDLANSVDSAYVTADYGPVVTDASYVELTHSQSYRTRFHYDAAANVYKMQQYYSTDGIWRDTVDEANGNVQLSFPNLLILFTDIHTYPQYVGNDYDIQEVDFTSGGAGYYCYGGRCERIYWSKGSPDTRLWLYYLDANGQRSDVQLDMNTGKTYLAVVDLDEYGKFVHSAGEGIANSTVPAASTSTAPAVQPEAQPAADGGDASGVEGVDMLNGEPVVG